MIPSTIRFDSLERRSPEELYRAFLDAFSDYAVPITVTLDDFLAMHERRGISYAASLGAFDDADGGRLVGFIFNGDGPWEGKRCAYDGGTGVAPSHRGLGLSKALAGEAAARLRASGFSTWLLEVLVGNDKAIRTYEGAGFRTTRRFSCPEGAIAGAATLAAELCSTAGVTVRGLGHRDTARYASWRAWQPSWQNSDDSVRRSPEPLVLLGAYRGHGSEPLGYVVATGKGSVFQLAVAPEARRQGVARALVASLAASVPEGKLRYLNVQSDDADTLGLLGSMGLAASVDQWEMMLEL